MPILLKSLGSVCFTFYFISFILKIDKKVRFILSGCMYECMNSLKLILNRVDNEFEFFA